MIRKHDCNADRDTGCVCSQWHDLIDQINQELKLLRIKLVELI